MSLRWRGRKFAGGETSGRPARLEWNLSGHGGHGCKVRLIRDGAIRLRQPNCIRPADGIEKRRFSRIRRHDRACVLNEIAEDEEAPRGEAHRGRDFALVPIYIHSGALNAPTRRPAAGQRPPSSRARLYRINRLKDPRIIAPCANDDRRIETRSD